jgi:hypothetical protein
VTSPRQSRSIALALAIGVAALGGCSAGNPRSCTVSCSSDGACPDGTSCGGDGYCYGQDEVVGSCANGGTADGSTAGPDASTLSDAAQSEPDAAVDRPDGSVDPDACTGAETFADAVLGPIVIPDDDVVGVSSAIVADVPCAAVRSVQVRVDITHPFSGDLSVFLTSPRGELVVLLGPSNDPTPDVHEIFDVDIAAGEEASGEWVLTVIDDVPPDAGTLDGWSIGINRAAP